MAVEALKSVGIQAYQGSSQRPAVTVAQTAEAPEAAYDTKAAEKTVQTAELDPQAKAAPVKADNGGSRVQESPVVRDVKLPESAVSESGEAAEGTASHERVKRAVEEMNKKAANAEAVFGVHDSTNRVTIKIVDKKTKEVLKEYPPEKTLDMIAKVWELAGLLVDEKR